MSLVKKLQLSISSTDTPEPDTDVNVEESCGFEVGCGSYQSKRCTVPCLQMFASAKWALVFFSFGAVVQGFIINGNAPAVISTLEKRFELTSTESGLISSCYDIAGSVTVLFVTYVGGHGHKPLWIGWGVFLIGLSGIVYAFPHFAAPQHIILETMNFCGDATIEECTISSLKNFRFLFYGSFLLAGVGSSPLYSLTVTYLDESVKQRYSSLYNGLFIAMSILGPGIGFLVGAAFLRIYTNPDQEVSIDNTHENWVGAWWLGPMIIGFIGIATSISILLLPRVIPGTEKHRETRELEMHVSAEDDKRDSVFGRRFRDFPKVTLQLLRNPTYVFESLGIAVDSLLIGGMTVFGPKYIETQFGIEASNAGIYFGIMAILGGVVGQVVGGAVISKYNMKIKRMLHICYIAPLICVFCSTCYLITCSSPSLAGVSTLYHDSSTTIQVDSLCNNGCGCSRGIYNPVCGADGINYFSPCFAGCANQTAEIYSNCTCVTATSNGAPFVTNSGSTATMGLCVDEECSSGWQFIVFFILNFLIIFLTFFNEAAALQVSLRCVSFKRRSFAIGVQVLIWRVLGTIPGPLVVGAIFDSACHHWSESCGTRGSCILYDNSELSLRVFLFFVITKGVDFLLFLAGFFSYKPVSNALATADEEEYNETEINNSDANPKISSNKTPESYRNKDLDLPGEVCSEENDKAFINPSYENVKAFGPEKY